MYDIVSFFVTYVLVIDRMQDSLPNKISVWLDFIEFRTRLNQFEFSKNMKTVHPDENNVVLNENSFEGKKIIYK